MRLTSPEHLGSIDVIFLSLQLFPKPRNNLMKKQCSSRTLVSVQRNTTTYHFFELMSEVLLSSVVIVDTDAKICPRVRYTL